MGTWGTGVFSDDLACEVREAYTDLLAEGSDDTEATDRILQHWEQYLNDIDSGPVIWLALAVTKWRLGRLDDRTRDRALAVIDSGDALRAWKHDNRSLRQRQTVLRQVQKQLRSPQRASRKLKKRFSDSCGWEPGELIGYRTRSGQLVIFRVIGHHTDRGGTSPVVEVLDCIGINLPSMHELRTCPIRRGKVIAAFGPFPAHPITQVFIGRVREKDLPLKRVQRLGIGSKSTQNLGGYTCAVWTTLDDQLAEIFGIE